MPRHYRRLTELEVKNAKWSGRVAAASGNPLPDTLTDGEGLTLAVHPNSKVWVLRLFINGKERKSGLGAYRDDGRGVTLKQAREKAEALRVQARKTGETQADARRAEREEAERALAEAVRTKQAVFETVAREWQRLTSQTQTLKHSKQCIATLEQHVFPLIGQRDMSTLTSNEILKDVVHPMLFDRVDKTGQSLPPLTETASRVTMRIGAVFEHANLQDICANNPYPAVKRQFNRWKRQLLKAFPETNYAALQRPEDVGAMLREP